MTRNLALILTALLTAAGPAFADCQPAENTPDPAPARDEAPQPPDRSKQRLIHERTVVMEPDAEGHMREVTYTRWVWRDLPAVACDDPQEPSAGSDG